MQGKIAAVQKSHGPRQRAESCKTVVKTGYHCRVSGRMGCRTITVFCLGSFGDFTMKLRNYLAAGAAAIAMATATAPVVYAQQTTSDIRGVVTDESGAPICGRHGDDC